MSERTSFDPNPPTTFADIWRDMQRRERREQNTTPHTHQHADLDLLHQDLSMLIGILQGIYQTQQFREIAHPSPFVFNQAVTGNAYTRLFTTPRLQSTRIYALQLGNNGGGNVISLVAAGAGSGLANLTNNSGGTLIYAQRQSNNGQSATGWEIILPPETTVYLVADGGITVTLTCMLAAVPPSRNEITRGERL